VETDSFSTETVVRSVRMKVKPMRIVVDPLRCGMRCDSMVRTPGQLRVVAFAVHAVLLSANRMDLGVRFLVQ
jgi:hypothetical protein